MSVTATITAKGQLTLPKAARAALGSSTVEIKVEGETVVLLPVRSIAGALGKYAVSKVPFAKVREKVWGEVVGAEKS